MSASRIEETERIVVDKSPPRRGWLGRKHNRRITVARLSVAAWVADRLAALGRRLVFLGKVLAVLAFVALSGLAGRQIVRQVVASPRFAVQEIQIQPTTHLEAEEIRAFTGVAIGDRLLAVDTDAVATQLATHPWIASARVKRDLPSALVIDVTERQAVASALLGALYLLDEDGRPFKRATFEEADGLPVITGVTRDQYAALRPASEAVFREALALLQAYQGTDDPRPTIARPKVSEIHVDPRNGFTVVLLEGGGEVRLGRGDWTEKLARFDHILGGLGSRGPAGLEVVYLDGPAADRVTVRLAGDKS